MIRIELWGSLWLFTFVIAGKFNTELENDQYHDYKEMETFLTTYSNEFRNITRLYSIGKSSEGRELWVMEIAAGEKLATRPNVKLVGNIHGDESVGRELLLHFIKYLVEQYHKGNTRVMELLEYVVIHIMPSMNPDGFEIALNSIHDSVPQLCPRRDGRGNRLGIDLNRNFPDLLKGVDPQRRQSETEAVIRWLRDVPFVLSASLHGGALVANYPYDNRNHALEEFYRLHKVSSLSEDEVLQLWKKWRPGIERHEAHPTPDDDMFRHLAASYSHAHSTMHLGQACSQDSGGFIKPFPEGITNGAAWYPLTGGMQDYNYLAHDCLELTLEISCCKFPNASELPSLWIQNKEALLSFLEESRRGIRGLVLDEEGLPVPDANVTICGRSIPFRTTSKGEFWKILLPNVYFVEVSADGFLTEILPITVGRLELSNLPNSVNVTLRRVTARSNMSTETKTEPMTTAEAASTNHLASEAPRSDTDLPLHAEPSFSSSEKVTFSVSLTVCFTSLISLRLKLLFT